MIHEGIGQFNLNFYEIFSGFFVYGFHLITLCFLIIKSKEKGVITLIVLLLSYGSFIAFVGSHGQIWSLSILHIFLSIGACFYFFRKIKEVSFQY